MIQIPLMIGAAALVVALVGGQFFGWGKDNVVEEYAEEIAEKELGLPAGSLDFTPHDAKK